MDKRILIVDDEEIFLVQIKTVLKKMGMKVSTATNGREALKKLEKEHYSIVLTDIKMPGMSGLELLKNIKKAYPHMYVVIITGYGEVYQAVEAMKSGACDFLQKPFDMNLLELSMNKIFQTQDLMEENINLLKEVRKKYDFRQIIGKSQGMKKVFELITMASQTDATTLILGETGTGKELAAKAVHYSGIRKDKPLVTIDCSTIPETLLDSELFGHEKGAFTDARAQKIGRFELANRGTLFLDEIGDIPLAIQGKLLRFLQEKEIHRLGGDKTLKLDVRILLATNQNLEKLVKENKFRKDLFYRINVLSIYLPPLREKKDDIPALADHFLKKYNSVFNKKVKAISPEALNSLFRYPWPGNVREFEHVLEKAVLMERGETIHRFEFSSASGEDNPSCFLNPDPPVNANLNFKEAKEKLIGKWEKEYLKAVLSENRGNITRAAKQAGLNYKTFYEKLVKYGFDSKQIRDRYKKLQ